MLQVRFEICGQCGSLFQVANMPWRQKGYCCEESWKYDTGDRGESAKEMAEISRVAAIRRQSHKQYMEKKK